MNEARIWQTYFSGECKEVLVTQKEFPYPQGQLIISRTDRVGYITHLNRAFLMLSGYTKEELMGKSHSMIRHPDMPKVIFETLWRTIGTGKKWQGYVKNLRKDGGHYWVYATIVPNYRNKKIEGFTSVRRQPSREDVIYFTEVYRKMKEKESRE